MLHGAAIRDDHDVLFGMWSDIAVQKSEYVVTGNRFAGEWVMTGVHNGDAPGLPATGMPFKISG